MNTTNCFSPDLDITGPGIRANLYVSSLIIAILPEIPLTSPLTDVCRTNAAMSGFALLVTAIVRTAQHELTLYHAIFILHMLFFFGIGIFPKGRYTPTSSRRLWTMFITVCIALMFQGWALYVWATAPRFGGKTEFCNDGIKYIFVFAHVRATVLWLRVLWMIVLGIEALGILVYLSILLVTFLSKTKGKANKEDRNPSKPKPSQFLLLLSCIYAVIMLELYLKQNGHLEDKPEIEETWTFGQIISLAMIANTINEILHFLLAVIPPLFSRSQHREDPDGEVPLDAVIAR